MCQWYDPFIFYPAKLNTPQTPIFGLLVATDWLTERPTTVVNVMGDTLALVLAQKYCLGADADTDLNDQHEAESGQKSEKKH